MTPLRRGRSQLPAIAAGAVWTVLVAAFWGFVISHTVDAGKCTPLGGLDRPDVLGPTTFSCNIDHGVMADRVVVYTDPGPLQFTAVCAALLLVGLAICEMNRRLASQ